MKRLKAPVLTLLLLLLTPLALSAHDANTSAKLPHTVLLIGDSLSSAHRIPAQAGWVNLLQERVNASGTGAPKIVNDSRGGKTLTDAMRELPLLLASHHPQLVILELGANDAILGASGPVLEKDMVSLIDSVRASGAEVVVLGFEIPPRLDKNHSADILRSVYQRIHRDKHVVLLPSLMQGISNRPALLLDDGVHPGVEAQKQMLANAWPTLHPLLVN